MAPGGTDGKIQMYYMIIDQLTVRSHPEQTKTESKVSVFGQPEDSHDVTSHVVLCSAPSVVMTTGFTFSTIVLNCTQKQKRGMKLK